MLLSYSKTNTNLRILKQTKPTFRHARRIDQLIAIPAAEQLFPGKSIAVAKIVQGPSLFRLDLHAVRVLPISSDGVLK